MNNEPITTLTVACSLQRDIRSNLYSTCRSVPSKILSMSLSTQALTFFVIFSSSLLSDVSAHARNLRRLATGCHTPVLLKAGTWIPVRYYVGIGSLAALLNVYVRMSDDSCCICSCCTRTVPGAQLSCGEL